VNPFVKTMHVWMNIILGSYLIDCTLDSICFKDKFRFFLRGVLLSCYIWTPFAIKLYGKSNLETIIFLS